MTIIWSDMVHDGLPVFSLITLQVVLLIWIGVLAFGLYFRTDKKRAIRFLQNKYFINRRRVRYETFQINLLSSVTATLGAVIFGEGIYYVINAKTYGEIMVALGSVVMIASIHLGVTLLKDDKRRLNDKIVKVVVETISLNMEGLLKSVKVDSSTDFALKIETKYRVYKDKEGVTSYIKVILIDIYLEDNQLIDLLEQKVPNILQGVQTIVDQMVLSNSEKMIEVEVNVREDDEEVQKLEKLISE